MAIEKGDRVRATCLNGEMYEGIVYEICLGINSEYPTKCSIFIEEEQNENMSYGQVHIWCDGLKNIEKLDSGKGGN